MLFTFFEKYAINIVLKYIYIKVIISEMATSYSTSLYVLLIIKLNIIFIFFSDF